MAAGDDHGTRLRLPRSIPARPTYNRSMSTESIDSAGIQIASGLVPSQKIVGDDEMDTALLRKMAADAEVFIRSFPWCTSVLESYFGGGIGGIFAIFSFISVLAVPMSIRGYGS
jgi:hypothetical protein